MAFTLETLQQKIATHQQKDQQKGDWPKCSFLPNGTHKVRFIIDPKDELFAEYWAYGYFGRGIRDPRNDTGVPEGFENELATIYEEELAPLQKWSYGCKYVMLVYMYLYETNVPDENWQPNNLYAVICSRKFGEAFIPFLSSLMKDAPKEILETLSPNKEGVILQVQYEHGKDGHCSIGASYPPKLGGPINMEGVAYWPLEDAYIKPGFNKDKYEALVKKYKEDAARFKAAREAIPAEGGTGGSEESTPPIPSTIGQSMLGAQSPEQPSTQEQPTQTQVVQQTTTIQEPVATSESPVTPATSTEETPPGIDPNNPWAKFQTPKQ